MNMNILLVTAKWNSETYGVDGGSMTALNIIEALYDRATCDILIPSSMAEIIPNKYFNNIHTYTIDYTRKEREKFNDRRIMALIVADKIHTLIDRYDKIVVLHIFNALYLPSRLNPYEFKKIILFPMFLSTSYFKSKDMVPQWYIDQEFKVISLLRRIITPSEFEKRQLIDTYNARRDTIKIIPRSVSSCYQPALKRRMSHGIITLTIVASFRKQKRLRLAIDLLKDLKNIEIDAHMIIVGSIQDENEYSVFMDALTRNQLSNQIKHIKYLSPEDLNSLYSRADLNISFSACETFGRSIIESLSCGIPNLILDDSGDMQSLIGVGHGALYSTTIKEMSTQISMLIANEEVYRQLTAEAMKYGEKFRSDKLKTILADCIKEEIK